MRRPNPTTLAGVAVMATTLAVLPLTAASAAFDDGDYDLTASCGVDATLKVRGNGNGISVDSETTYAVVKSEDGATIVSFGAAGIADDNTVHVLAPAEDGVACTTSLATDADVVALLGLEDDETVDDVADELASEASEASEGSTDEADAEAVEKVLLCHNVETNPHEIEVGAPAAEDHLAHGDLEGECPEDLVSKKDEKAEEREAARADREAAKAQRDADREATRAERDAARSDEADSQG